jgi:hypothetical protein
MRRVLLVVLVCGCLPSSYRQARKLEGRYDVHPPGEGWVAVAPGGADHAWFSRSLQASIYTDSNCGPRYRELALENLSTELLAGLRDVQQVREERRTVADREGILRVTSGTLDGVAITVAALTVNRDACTYDLTYIAPPTRLDAGWDAYERVIAGFTPR